MAQDTLDADLFASLQATIDSIKDDVQAISGLTVPFKQEYKRFITDQVENPYFKVRAENFNIITATAALGRFEASLAEAKADEVVVQLYKAKLENQQLRFNMLEATANKDDKAFSKFSVKLYGKPKRRLFGMVVQHVLKTRPRHKKAEVAHKLLTEALGHMNYSGDALPVDILPPLQSLEGESVRAVEVQEIFAEVIAAEALDGWQAVVDDTGERPRFSVSPTQKIIYIPDDEHIANRARPLTRLAVEAIAGHEIGVHAKRAHNGALQPLRLLQIGLDGYLRGEEGLASYVQQQIEGATQFYGLDRYLAIGLALGLDGEERDFRAVFILMKAYYTLISDSNSCTQMNIIQQAWDVCRRIFRGTTGQSAGCVFTRDLVYFEGNLAMWDFVVQHSHRYDSLFIGKFDPLNKRHVTSLQTLNLLPEW